MRSRLVMNVIPRSGWKDFTPLMVLKSAAGWYVGTLFNDPEEPGFVEPGSRDTTYFEKKEDAEKVLAQMELIWAASPEDMAMHIFEDWLNLSGLDPQGVGYRLTP